MRLHTGSASAALARAGLSYSRSVPQHCAADWSYVAKASTATQGFARTRPTTSCSGCALSSDVVCSSKTSS